MPETQTEEPLSNRFKIAEIAAALVLSIAALLTSWAGFQSALWGGEQATAYGKASAARVEASGLATQNGQREAVDLMLFTEWLDSYARNDEQLQQFYRQRFRPEFSKPFEKWLALEPRYNRSAPPTPFAMPDYRPMLLDQAAKRSKEADELFEHGQYCNDTGDAFVRATVVFALALFLGGIAQTFRTPRIQMVMIGLAAIVCVIGIAQLARLPTLSLGG